MEKFKAKQILGAGKAGQRQGKLANVIQDSFEEGQGILCVAKEWMGSRSLCPTRTSRKSLHPSSVYL